jgi:glycosyltransferase involved in cell wall biosynthesis
VVKPEDPAAIAEALARVLRNPQWAAEMGRNGRAFVEAELDRDKLAALMLEELKAVAA